MELNCLLLLLSYCKFLIYWMCVIMKYLYKMTKFCIYTRPEKLKIYNMTLYIPVYYRYDR